TVGGETVQAGPGSIVFIPRNVVHRFKNVGSITGRMLGWSLPGGQDRYLKAISELAAGGGFTSEKVIEISKTFDTHFPGVPLMPVMSAFGTNRTCQSLSGMSAIPPKADIALLFGDPDPSPGPATSRLLIRPATMPCARLGEGNEPTLQSRRRTS